MALKLEVTLPTGVKAEYWRLGRLTADRVSGTMEARMDLYVSQEMRMCGCNPLKSKTVIGSVVIDGVESNYVTEAYAQIKAPVYIIDDDTGETTQVNPFVNAVDVLE